MSLSIPTRVKLTKAICGGYPIFHAEIKTGPWWKPWKKIGVLTGPWDDAFLPNEYPSEQEALNGARRYLTTRPIY